MFDPTRTTLIEMRDAIAAKQVTAREVVGAYLDRIEQHNAELNVFHEIFADRALERAGQVDDGAIGGPLAGVPVAIKDNMCTTFGTTTCSSKILEGYRSPFDGTAVMKLEQAGAIVVGKTNLDEFAMGSSTENSAFGVTRNPWDKSRVPGGSSGGSAVSVAADMAAAAFGSDTGGSIRQPAALTGVVGMKPTYGRVSRYGLVAFASSLDQIGPFVRTVADTAAVLRVICGRDPMDSTSTDMPVEDFGAKLNQPVDNLRIGIAKQYMTGGNHPAANQAVEHASDIYKQHGATIVDVDLPHTEYGIPVYYIVATAEASSNLARYDGVHYGHRTAEPGDLIDLYARSRAEGFGEEVKRRIMLGTYALSSGYYDAYYLRALKVRRLIKQDFDTAFAQCDAILCPTTTGPAFPIGEKADDPLQMYMNDVYTVNGNLAGIPGISLPGGYAVENGVELPVGIQLYGPPFAEAQLLRIARLFEQSVDFHLTRPPL